MDKNVVVASGPGIGIGMILFIVFLVLKLTGHIAWSWWFVTAPLWIPWCIFFSVLFLGLLFMILSAILVGKK